MRRSPLSPAVLTLHLILLGIASVCLTAWIYQVAHTTQPQYSDPDYGVTGTYRP